MKNNNEKVLEMFLNCFIAGLDSDYYSVMIKSVEVYSLILNSSKNEQNFLSLIKAYFLDFGMIGVIKGMITHQINLIPKPIELLFESTKENISIIITEKMPKFFLKEFEYLKFLNEFINSLNYTPNTVKNSTEIESAILIVIDRYMDEIESTESFISPEKEQFFNFIFNYWNNFPAVIERISYYKQKIFSLLQSLIVKMSLPMKLIIISHIFRIFEAYALEKWGSIEEIYKFLVYFLIENYHLIIVRQMMLESFLIIFDKSNEISINSLIEPLTLQISNSYEVQLNSFDFQFYLKIINHSSFSSQLGLNILRVLRINSKINILTIDMQSQIYLQIYVKFSLDDNILNAILEYFELLISTLLGIQTNTLGNLTEEISIINIYNSKKISLILHNLLIVKNSRLRDMVKLTLLESNYQYFQKYHKDCPYLINLFDIYGNREALLLNYYQSQNQDSIFNQHTINVELDKSNDYNMIQKSTENVIESCDELTIINNDQSINENNEKALVAFIPKKRKNL